MQPIVFGGEALRECQGVRIAMQELLGSGTYGAVHRACFNDNCNTAVKLLPLVTQAQGIEFASEYAFAKRASDRGYGPRILHACIARDPSGAWFGLLVTEQFDSSLESLGSQWCSDPTNAIFVAEQLHELVDAMHADDIVHADLLPKNVLYRADAQGRITDIRFTDWGLSFLRNALPNDELFGNLFAYHFNTPQVTTYAAVKRSPLRNLTLEQVKENPFYLDAGILLLADECAETARESIQMDWRAT